MNQPRYRLTLTAIDRQSFALEMTATSQKKNEKKPRDTPGKNPDMPLGFHRFAPDGKA